MTEREAYIALNMMAKVGPVSVRALVSECGSAAAIFEASEQALRGTQGIGPSMVDHMLRQRESIDWRGEEERVEALGGQLVTQVDEAYPSLLREIHDPPLALYVRGSLETRDRQSVAVVGTRRPTHYGREVTAQLTHQLVKAGLVIVSGLAEGVDTVAHAAALKAGGRTLGVLGSALDCLFPPANRELADRMAETGAVISEFPLGRKPDRTTFPMRNRVVSGLSRGVLVTEAGARSGALITADGAKEQGRQVFAVPGRVDSPPSRGTHALLKGGARLVERVDDILEAFEELLPMRQEQAEPARRRQPVLSEQEQAIVTAVEAGNHDVDGLIRETSLQAGIVSSLLIGLEMKRVLRMLPGRRVERLRL